MPGVAFLADEEIRPEERYLFTLERRFPGFGGYGVDSSGVTRVWVGDPKTATELLAAIDEAEASLGIPEAMRTRTRAVVVQQARFTVSQLARVRDEVSSNHLSVVNGIVSVDLDEALNRVTVGALNARISQVAERLEAAVRKRDLPVEILKIKSATLGFADVSVRAHVGPTVATTNTDLAGPLVPAMGGSRQRNTNAAPCTIGLFVDRSGVRGSLSNSHCTPTLFGSDSGYQILNGSVYNLLGFETVDPASLGTCVVNYVNIPCRYSDAAFYTTYDTVATRRGAIARTLSYSTTWGASGSKVIDTSNPFFAVTSVAQPGTVQTGHYLMKMGQTTGWTEGVVEATCSDTPILGDAPNEYLVKCAIFAKYYSDGGDSGGPVWLSTTGSGVMLAGLHFGGNADLQRTYVSYWHRVVNEVGGTVVATTDISVSTPLPSGSIPSSMPKLAWPAVSTANTVLPTTYRVYRWTYDVSAGWSDWQALVHTTQALEFEEVDRFVDHYYGTSAPPAGTSYVRYQIVAENNGVVAGSTLHYFRTFGAH